jgi:predicted AAA+ superfamily ATPase
LNAHRWLDDYVRTYVERDVRSLSQVADLAQFSLMLRLLATQSGSLLNQATLATQVGVSIPTVRRWIAILETSGIVFLLQPHHANLGKRLIKSPKPYFVDSGLLCLLLGIRDPSHLVSHPMRGHVFENFVVSEFRKLFFHNGLRPSLYFWRDSNGLEIDLLAEEGADLLPIEIKSTATWRTDLASSIKKWLQLAGRPDEPGLVVYDGDDVHQGTSSIKTAPWWRLL